eukprot:TRINITY_DN34292_c0_g1_i1.p1 TRINITY_DN34292_c0_g1~~TRINITY_DN34292_c0_g1_i1.p1  ORF type:complete len:220 (-),score=58.81 TRINITY_DN34292_c0_g1_i1:15-674(-)
MADQWLKDFERVRKSAAQLSKEVNSQDGRKPEARQAALLRGNLAQLRQDVSQLQQMMMTMSQNTQAHGITRKELSRRGDLLAQLSDQADAIQEAVRNGVRKRIDADTASSGHVRADSALPAGADLMALSEQETSRQEETLDFISGTVQNLKKFGGSISEEIDLHCSLLGEMEDQTVNSTARMKSQQKMLEQLGSEPAMCALWVCILVMAVAIFVLLVFL